MRNQTCQTYHIRSLKGVIRERLLEELASAPKDDEKWTAKFTVLKETLSTDRYRIGERKCSTRCDQTSFAINRSGKYTKLS